MEKKYEALIEVQRSAKISSVAEDISGTTKLEEERAVKHNEKISQSSVKDKLSTKIEDLEKLELKLLKKKFLDYDTTTNTLNKKKNRRKNRHLLRETIESPLCNSGFLVFYNRKSSLTKDQQEKILESAEISKIIHKPFAASENFKKLKKIDLSYAAVLRQNV